MDLIEAVIFDWGGVLIEDPSAELYQYCANALDVPLEQYIQAHKKHDDDFATGQFTEEQFWAKVCGELNKEPPKKIKSLWYAALETAYKPREAMFNLIVELDSNGYKTAILSNTEPPCVQFFYKQGIDKYFDAAVFSCIEHTKKPQRKIYDIATGRLGVQASQCVFIDDKIEFVKAAEAVGMKGILYKSFEQIKYELEKLGVKTV
jgi:putative hydrolase of the HAD superfamily